jgi:hypothetical protein
MNNQQKINILTSYQDNPMVHPLTCGNNSLHENLVPIEEENKVILKCLDCTYTQLLDDEFIGTLDKFDKYQREFSKEIKRMFEEIDNENTNNS